MAQAHQMSVLTWGVLEGGELTGKYNSSTDEPKRSGDTSEKIKKIASLLMDIAKEADGTPSPVATNWARQQSPNIIPIIGARSEKHLKDNLGCLDFTLTHEQIQRLNDSSPIDLGFPHSFLASDHVHGLIFGETFSKLTI
jgi:aryl-alcohol dehydrogenase-like predicted oxidoreductase